MKEDERGIGDALDLGHVQGQDLGHDLGLARRLGQEALLPDADDGTTRVKNTVFSLT